MLPLDTLMAEGERLSKTCLFLVENPTEMGVMAYWGGNGRADYQGRKNDLHRITFDCMWLANHGFHVKGSVGVYDVDQRWRWPTPAFVDHIKDRSITHLQFTDSIPLYGLESTSFPPLMALCLHGGPAIEQWLASMGLQRTDYEIAETFEIGRAYQEAWRQRCPFYARLGPAAVLGGWHMMWPDDMFYMPAEMKLLLWTFRDAEPWVELWYHPRGFRVELRTT